MAILKTGEIIHCPHCHEAQDEGQVENYVIPGRVGEASRAEETCHECDGEFWVMLQKDGTFLVDTDD